jgi:glycosyltransferase involved in cell wall biosynthesis
MRSARILLVCYYFPPMGGAGVGRPLALFKHLPAFGIECDVLTVKPVLYRLYEPELLEGLDLRKIYRAGSRDPQRLMHLMGIRKIRGSAINRAKRISDRFFPDPKVGWVSRAVKLGRVLLENKRYNCLVTTSPPISSHLVGAKLSREFRLPWVADFRDFWTLYKAEEWFDSKRQVVRARSLLDEICTNADAITVVNSAIADYLGTGAVIHNSYDEDRAALWKPASPGPDFVIGVLGTIDKLRPLEPLFAVLRRLRETKPDLFEQIRVVQVGDYHQADVDRLVGQYGLRNRCKLYGRQNREKTIEILSEASMLYLGVAVPFGKGVLPGRVFDMLASGRAILAAAPRDGVAAELLNASGSHCVFEDPKSDDPVSFVIRQCQAREGRQPVGLPISPSAAQYRAKKMVEKFVGVIRSFVGEGTPNAGGSFS